MFRYVAGTNADGSVVPVVDVSGDRSGRGWYLAARSIASGGKDVGAALVRTMARHARARIVLDAAAVDAGAVADAQRSFVALLADHAYAAGALHPAAEVGRGVEPEDVGLLTADVAAMAGIASLAGVDPPWLLSSAPPAYRLWIEVHKLALLVGNDPHP